MPRTKEIAWNLHYAAYWVYNFKYKIDNEMLYAVNNSNTWRSWSNPRYSCIMLHLDFKSKF